MELHRRRKRLAKKIEEGYQPRSKRKYTSPGNALTREDQEYEDWDKYRGFDGMERAVSLNGERNTTAESDEESAAHSHEESGAEQEQTEQTDKEEQDIETEEKQDDEVWESFETEMSALQRLTQHTGDDANTHNLTGIVPKSFKQKLPKFVHNKNTPTLTQGHAFDAIGDKQERVQDQDCRACAAGLLPSCVAVAEPAVHAVGLCEVGNERQPAHILVPHVAPFALLLQDAL